MAGYELVQSRDAFVYHLTCRGHRWNEQIGQDDNYYKIASAKAARNYLRKWGSWIKNDEFQYPIINPKYNIAFVVKHCNLQMLEALEPWCDRIYIEDELGILFAAYYETEHKNTSYDLKKRVLSTKWNDPQGENDIVVEFDVKQFTQQSFNIIQQFSEIIKEGGEIGEFELDIFKVTINSLTEYQKDLIVCKN